jgi:hypothetical protein
MIYDFKNTRALPLGYDNVNEMSTLVKCYYYFKNNQYNVRLYDGDSIEIEVQNSECTGFMFVKVAQCDIDYYANLYVKSVN